jgi:phosphatidate cytidylyltransferase
VILRLLTAAIVIPVVIFGIFGAPAWFFFTLVALVAGVCFWEYARMTGAGVPFRLVGLAAGLGLLTIPPEHLWLFATLLALLLLMLAMAAADLATGAQEAMVVTLGLLYIFGAWRCALGLHAIDPNWLLFGLAVNWVGDTFAFLVGRAWGRRQLAPRVSPGKTWEGAAASVVSAVLFGALVLPWLISDVSTWQAALLALAANVAGQLGDLAESSLKRAAGVKDSGALLPGHGGMLDRVDSAMFSLPVLYALLTITQ